MLGVCLKRLKQEEKRTATGALDFGFRDEPAADARELVLAALDLDVAGVVQDRLSELTDGEEVLRKRFISPSCPTQRTTAPTCRSELR